MSMFFLAEPGEASTESLFYWDAGKAANNKSTAVQQACVYRLSPITHVHYCCGRLCPKLWCTARTYKWTSNLFVFCVTDPNNKLKEYSHHICSSLSSLHQRQTSHSVSPSAAHITRFLTHMLNTQSEMISCFVKTEKNRLSKKELWQNTQWEHEVMSHFRKRWQILNKM